MSPMPRYDFYCISTSCNIPTMGRWQIQYNSGPLRVWIWSVVIAKHKGLFRGGLLKAGDAFQDPSR